MSSTPRFTEYDCWGNRRLGTSRPIVLGRWQYEKSRCFHIDDFRTRRGVLDGCDISLGVCCLRRPRTAPSGPRLLVRNPEPNLLRVCSTHEGGVGGFNNTPAKGQISEVGVCGHNVRLHPASRHRQLGRSGPKSAIGGRPEGSAGLSNMVIWGVH